MTALTADTSKTFTLRDTGSVTISTSGGIASVLATPTGGTAQTTILGPTPSRLVVGPFAEGATVVITNQSATLDYDQPYGSLVTMNDAGTALVSGDGAVLALSEVTAYVTRTTTGTAFSGSCEYAGYICTVAAGNITVYDNTSAAGTVIVPTTALVLGAYPIFGAGTNGKMALATGCHVVLSGAATVNVLVQ